MRKWKWDVLGRRSIKRAFNKLKEQAADVFYYKNDVEASLLDFTLIPAVSLGWKSNPIWAQIIGAPSSGKTAHISLLEKWEKSVFVSRLTANSLISGYRDEADKEKDPSLLPQLDGKLLIIKDFTVILQGAREERDSIIGQLRDIYDGEASRCMGNIGLVSYKAKFNVLLAVTNLIDAYHSVNQQLGERFISRREYSNGRKLVAEAAFDNYLFGGFSEGIAALQEEVNMFLRRMPDVFEAASVKWPMCMRRRVVQGADFVALCRSHVYRESDGRMAAARPCPEVGARLVTQIAKLVTAYCFLNGILEVNEDAWLFGGGKTLRDTVPSAIVWVLYHIYIEARLRGFGARVLGEEVYQQVKLGRNTVYGILSDLAFHGVLQARGTGGRGQYWLSKDTVLLLEDLQFFTGFGDENNMQDVESSIKKRKKVSVVK